MKVIINQPFGIGDILFLSPLVSNLDIEMAVWPIVDHYEWISKYIEIPNVTFIKKSIFNINHYPDYHEIPFQIADHLIANSEDCMHAKYMLLDADLELWRTLKITRNFEKEEKLKQLLNINATDEFILINNNFAGPEFNYKTNIELQTNSRIIQLEYIDGFTLLDWCGVLELANEIHTVSTSLFFVIESLNLEKTSLHLYPRRPLDKDLSPIKTLINNKWICHE